MYDLYLTNGAHLETVSAEHFNASVLYYRCRFNDNLVIVWRANADTR